MLQRNTRAVSALARVAISLSNANASFRAVNFGLERLEDVAGAPFEALEGQRKGLGWVGGVTRPGEWQT